MTRRGRLLLLGHIPSLSESECRITEREALAIFFGPSFRAPMNDVPLGWRKATPSRFSTPLPALCYDGMDGKMATPRRQKLDSLSFYSCPNGFQCCVSFHHLVVILRTIVPGSKPTMPGPRQPRLTLQPHPPQPRHPALPKTCTRVRWYDN
jgi:hypothetical protein